MDGPIQTVSQWFFTGDCAKIFLMKYKFYMAIALICVVPCVAFARNAVPPQFISHPDDPDKKIEIFIKKPDGEGPWPGVIFLHGHQKRSRPGGKDFDKWGILNHFAKKGYVSVAISQPGYGNSSGPPDFCGPFTQNAVSAVIKNASFHKLRNTDQNSNRRN